MGKEFDYTANAQKFTAKYPVLSYVGTQVNFWMAANILLAIILHLNTLSLSATFKFGPVSGLSKNILIGAIAGFLYGSIVGLADYHLDKTVFRSKPLGKIILIKTGLSVIVTILVFGVIRFFLFQWIFLPSMYTARVSPSASSLKYLFYITLVYYFFMTLVINFINQVNKKYGPGILLPMLLGKYRNPREEERIFMFMDLKSSTSLAEKLGHLKFSALIRDSFMDINLLLSAFNAEVYQYIGDEIVLTWRVNDGLKNLSCIRFFFACEQQFRSRIDYYTRQYGVLPYFKAGLHLGTVTVVEIGEIKRDIAYHGDILNTTSRIQSVCNDYNKKLLVSELILEKAGLTPNITRESLGMIQLRGKEQMIGIVSLDIA
ncbi:MAG: adenylate/guanylate cyclase domain-containing protein [Ginsengibacter sp.]